MLVQVLVACSTCMCPRASHLQIPVCMQAVPPSLDTFGWCTWDAFYFDVSAQGISQGLSSLVTGGAPPQWLVIDDGWQVCTGLYAAYAQEHRIEICFRSKELELHSSAQGISQGLSSLVAGGIPPQWLVIDDGSQVRGCSRKPRSGQAR